MGGMQVMKMNKTSIAVRHIFTIADEPLCATVSETLLDELVRTSPVDPASLANGMITCWLCAATQDWRNRSDGQRTGDTGGRECPNCFTKTLKPGDCEGPPNCLPEIS